MKKIIEFLSYELVGGNGIDFHQVMVNESFDLHEKYGIKILFSANSKTNIIIY